MNPTLTKRQAEVLAAIGNCIRLDGYRPTYQQIAERVGLSSLATVHKHVSNLQRKGYMEKLSGYGNWRLLRVKNPGCCPTCGHRKTA